MKRLQSQSKITPPQPGLCPQINVSPSVQTGDEDLWLARRSQSSSSHASETHRQGFPPAMRAKPSQPNDQGPAICD